MSMVPSLYVTVPVQVAVCPMVMVPLAGLSAMLTEETVTGTTAVTVIFAELPDKVAFSVDVATTVAEPATVDEKTPAAVTDPTDPVSIV